MTSSPRLVRPLGTGIILIGLGLACVDRVVAPPILAITGPPELFDTVLEGYPGDVLDQPIALRIVDDGGRPIANAQVTWVASGTDAQVLEPTTSSDQQGQVAARWQLGTRYAEAQRLHVVAAALNQSVNLTLEARLLRPLAVAVSAHTLGSSPVLLRRFGDPIGLVCSARDSSGNELVDAPILVRSRTGAVSSGMCSELTAVRSGVDTLDIAIDSARHSLEVAVAIRPIVEQSQGVRVVADSFGHSNFHWAPSVDMPGEGVVDLYYAIYTVRPGDTLSYANLHRLRSADGGETFSYDGVALHADSAACDPDGWGIENVAIVDRAEAPGYRMYYSAGSHCLGWRIRSAVSDDRRTWVREPGDRIGAPTSPKPFSAGEGMVVKSMPDGSGWRMWAGVWAIEDGFAIEEWRSPDQLSWSRYRRIVTPLNFPGRPMYAVFSPSIDSIGPSLWRMFFSADDRDQPGGRSRVFSAVTRDLDNWVMEGELLSDPDISFWYAAVAASRIFFIRQELVDGALWLGQARLEQR